MRGIVLSGLFIATILLLLLNCNSEEKNPYLNAQNNKATYVGMETCKSCHMGIYETFIQTGMGQSWGIANKQKSAANFSPDKALVYDTIKDFYYKIYIPKNRVAQSRSTGSKSPQLTVTREFFL